MSLMSACMLAALPTAALAQIGDIDIPYGGPDPKEEVEQSPTLTLPKDLPPIVEFPGMTPFEVDGTTPNSFALDPASVRLQGRYVLATIAVRSPSGAVTSGYYGFACDHAQYRLMAYPRKNGRWQPASKRVKWRDVQDGESRNRQYRAVFKAGCRVGGKSAESVDELFRHLREGRAIQSP